MPSPTDLQAMLDRWERVVSDDSVTKGAPMIKRVDKSKWTDDGDTFCTMGHEGVSPGQAVTLSCSLPQAIHLMKLRIDPNVGPFFVIEDVTVDRVDMMPGGKSVPAAQFCFGDGHDFDVGMVDADGVWSMTVRNVSGGLVDNSGRLGVNIPFLATWYGKFLVEVPLDAGRRRDDAALLPRVLVAGPLVLPVRPVEDGDSRLGSVRGVVSAPGTSPRPVVRETPGFGWDPNSD